MRAQTLSSFVFLALVLSGSAAAAQDSRLAGTLMVGWNQRATSDEAVAWRRIQGGFGVAGTLVHQWPRGFGLGGTASFGAIQQVREKATLSPCAGCAYERTTISYSTKVWDLGLLARWSLPTGEWRPSVQLGLTYGQMYRTRAFDRTTPGLAAHLGLGVEWRFSDRVPVAPRAELRGTVGGYVGDDYLEGAYWTGLLVGAGF